MGMHYSKVGLDGIRVRRQTMVNLDKKRHEQLILKKYFQ